VNIDRFTPLFKAHSVAMIGASSDPRKWGFAMLRNLINGGFEGKVYPVNREADELRGLKVYHSVSEIPEIPDLVCIVVPPPAVVPVIKECVARGVKAGVVITAGFAELGEEGSRMQAEMVEEAHKGGMVLVGPNCNGIMNPWYKLYVDFPLFHVPPGPIAIVAQSGNVVDAVARQIMLKGLGCSLCVASGNEADLHIEDYLEYLGEDPNTKVVLCYIEGFKDGRRFLKIAEKVSRKKPIIAIKVGRTQAGVRAAASHTASIAGSDAIFDAACSQAGIIRAGSLDEMLNIGIAFLRQPIPRSRKLGIVTAGGGWGVLAADACAERNFDIVKLPDDVIKELDSFLPAWWSRGNPVDLVAGSFADAVFRSVEVVLASPSVDSMVFLSIMPALKLQRLDTAEEEASNEEWGNHLVQAVADAMERFNALAVKYNKPVIVASEYIFATALQESKIIYTLGQHNTMCYHQPHHAAQVLNALAQYGEWGKGKR
jgi:acyl-CoA synthetase (NDP forming)